jgi:hypothetical protein
MLDEWVVYRVRGRVNAIPRVGWDSWKKMTGKDLSVELLAEGLTQQQANQMVDMAMKD